jgi:hypothetical protein
MPLDPLAPDTVRWRSLLSSGLWPTGGASEGAGLVSSARFLFFFLDEDDDEDVLLSNLVLQGFSFFGLFTLRFFFFFEEVLTSSSSSAGLLSLLLFLIISISRSITADSTDFLIWRLRMTTGSAASQAALFRLHLMPLLVSLIYLAGTSIHCPPSLVTRGPWCAPALALPFTAR